MRVNVSVAQRTGFAASSQFGGKMYALAQDATDKPMSELVEMSWLDLYSTAKLREQFYRELYGD